jgi:urease accessory protein
VPPEVPLRAPATGALHALHAPRCMRVGQGALPVEGSGRLVAERVAGETALTTCASSTPLRLLAPRPRGPAAWVLAASHGGGLVAGDSVEVELDVGPGAALYLGTQAETKVYRSPEGRLARQALRARVARAGLLAVLPEPVSPYAGSAFAQAQRFDLEAGAGLVLLDAVTAGRVARGERWALSRYATRNEVSLGGRAVLADAVRLVAGEGPPLADRLAGIELLATVLVLGAPLEEAARCLQARVADAPASSGGAAVLAAASPLAGGVLLRVAARSVEAGMTFVREALAFAAAPLGGDPFSRRP